MSAKREVPYEVAREGGLPTHEEFEGVWTAFANVAPRFGSYGLSPNASGTARVMRLQL